MVMFFVYMDIMSKSYAIYQTRENVLGKYDSDGSFYFAGFTRLMDASDYVKQLNEKR
jgi:hypothetical protein